VWSSELAPAGCAEALAVVSFTRRLLSSMAPTTTSRPEAAPARSRIVERADDMGTFVAVPNAALRHLPNRITFRLVASAHTMEGPEFSQDREGSGR